MTLENNKNLLDEAKPLVGQLQSASNHINNSVRGLSESNLTIDRALSNNREFLGQYQTLIQDLKILHDRQKDVYAILDERLGSILKQINDNMIQYNATTRDGLQKVLGEWDNELRSSVKLLSGPVSELGESFELLTEMLDKKLQRN
jgi:DNA anti-recombination protein RmuC